MSRQNPANIAASVRQKLLNHVDRIGLPRHPVISKNLENQDLQD
jgi:hypothetical protein